MRGEQNFPTLMAKVVVSFYTNLSTTCIKLLAKMFRKKVADNYVVSISLTANLS